MARKIFCWLAAKTLPPFMFEFFVSILFKANSIPALSHPSSSSLSLTPVPFSRRPVFLSLVELQLRRRRGAVEPARVELRRRLRTGRAEAATSRGPSCEEQQRRREADLQRWRRAGVKQQGGCLRRRRHASRAAAATRAPSSEAPSGRRNGGRGGELRGAVRHVERRTQWQL